MCCSHAPNIACSAAAMPQTLPAVLAIAFLSPDPYKLAQIAGVTTLYHYQAVTYLQLNQVHINFKNKSSAARYNTWLLIKLTPKGVFVSPSFSRTSLCRSLPSSLLSVCLVRRGQSKHQDAPGMAELDSAGIQVCQAGLQALV